MISILFEIACTHQIIAFSVSKVSSIHEAWLDEVQVMEFVVLVQKHSKNKNA